MKALSVRQPFATLLVVGAKQYETRSWFTKHRGSLAIHAAKGRDYWQLETYANPAVKRVLADCGFSYFEHLPFGRVVGVVELQRVWKTERLSPHDLTDFEESVGNFRPGRYAWMTTPVRRFDDPPAAEGNPGIWTLENEVLPN